MFKLKVISRSKNVLFQFVVEISSFLLSEAVFSGFLIFFLVKKKKKQTNKDKTIGRYNCLSLLFVFPTIFLIIELKTSFYHMLGPHRSNCRFPDRVGL